jgi:hypothetical protein
MATEKKPEKAMWQRERGISRKVAIRRALVPERVRLCINDVVVSWMHRPIQPIDAAVNDPGPGELLLSGLSPSLFATLLSLASFP